MKQIAKLIYKWIPFKQQFFSLVRIFAAPGESVYKHLHFKGTLVVPVDKTHSFRIEHYGFELENSLFWEGIENGWEKTSVSLWIKLVRQAEVIFDVGANTGIYSLIAKSLNPQARVYAFEPIERVFQKLEHNNHLNGYDITCFDYALSNTDGTATVYDTPTEHIYSVTVNENNSPEGTEVVPVEIKVIRLDSLITQMNIEKVDLIKLDVETHEAEVLEGLGGYLDKFIPTMLIEILNDEVGQKVEALVNGKDYLYFNIDEKSDSIRRVERITKSDYYNYLICNEKVAGKLGLLN
ncbi:MAG TPA: FkbM family methyltransferase [Pyrinomonadaceae bacterium]|nr:FkbM family methyltransferase [Pyrinomonadaceae bacterium]